MLAAAATTSSVHQTEQLVFFTLLQLIVILLGARVAGNLARRFGQPRVVGEIIGGLLLGPSLAGRLAPDLFDYVFQSTSPIPLQILSQIGLTMLMFQIGLEFDFSHLGRLNNRATVVAVSATGIALPFVLGFGLGIWSGPALAPEVNALGYRLFLAVALSITAIPILGRIMMEYDLHRTRLGAIAITAAAIDDVTGWVLLAVVSALTTAHFSTPVFGRQVVLLLVYAAACLWVVRPGLHRLVNYLQRQGDPLSPNLLALMLSIIFLSGLITYKLGIFAIFGGFMMGVLLHDHQPFVAAWKKSVVSFVNVFFLPIFFTFTGLRTNVNALDTAALWGWCAAIIAAATLGKFCGCTLAARFCGMNWEESSCLGIMMNTRALMELIVINIGFELGVIPATVFTMLVLMAIVSTVVTAPLLRIYLRRMGHMIPRRPDV